MAALVFSLTAMVGLADDGRTVEPAVQAVGELALAPLDDYVLRRTRAVLDRHLESPIAFDLHTSDHFLILHNSGEQQVAARTALLERTHERFYHRFGGGSFQVRPLPSRLVCVLFADQSDFLRYAHRVDWLDMSWSGGYYSSRTNRVALYEIDEAQEAGAMQATFAEVNDDGTLRWARESDTRTSATPRPNHASTTHEAAHQLAFNSGLQKRGVMYPLWASEGLATAFETVSLVPQGRAADGWEGNPVRRQAVLLARDASELLPLHRFVALTRVPTDDPHLVNIIYAQAWQFFDFLYGQERDALGTYLATLAQLPPGQRSQATLREEFVAAFGPLEKLEPRWEQHLAELR